MGKSQDDKGQDDKNEDIVCEFFGIKITTQNPNVARVLTSDIKKVMNLDVHSVKTFLTEDEAAGESSDGEQPVTEAEPKGKDAEVVTGESKAAGDELSELLNKG